MEANRFTVDFATSLRGSFPIPLQLSAEAGELLTHWLTEAFWADSCLHQRTFRLVCVPTRRLEELCTEILRTPFPMPCEGVDEAIATIDRVELLQTELKFTLSDVYATYLLAATPSELPSRIQSHEPRPLPLLAADLPMIRTALQFLHQQSGMAWTWQAIHFSRRGMHPLPREAFDLPDIEHVLKRLGATAAP